MKSDAGQMAMARVGGRGVGSQNLKSFNATFPTKSVNPKPWILNSLNPEVRIPRQA